MHHPDNRPNPLSPLVDLSAAFGDEPQSFIAVDATPHAIRLGYIFSGLILDTHESKPNQISRILNFVRRKKNQDRNVVLTGARTDRWPPGLHAAIVLEFGPISWAPQLLLAQTATEFRKSTRLFKFLRATYLAACAREGTVQPRKDAMLEQWREVLLCGVVLDLCTATWAFLHRGPPPPSNGFDRLGVPRLLSRPSLRPPPLVSAYNGYCDSSMSQVVNLSSRILGGKRAVVVTNPLDARPREVLQSAPEHLASRSDMEAPELFCCFYEFIKDDIQQFIKLHVMVKGCLLELFDERRGHPEL